MRTTEQIATRNEGFTGLMQKRSAALDKDLAEMRAYISREEKKAEEEVTRAEAGYRAKPNGVRAKALETAKQKRAEIQAARAELRGVEKTAEAMRKQFARK